MIEYINKIELQGKVHKIKLQDFPSGKRVVLTVRTCTVIYRAEEHFVETTWHNVVVWSNNPDIPNFDQIASLQPDSWIHIVGRVRDYKMTNAQQVETYNREIVAREVTVVSEPEPAFDNQ